jgi:hypothetical protein
MRCEYRNCKNNVKGRKDKKYCCRNCKDMERTYRVRQQKKIIKQNGEEIN